MLELSKKQLEEAEFSVSLATESRTLTQLCCGKGMGKKNPKPSPTVISVAFVHTDPVKYLTEFSPVIGGQSP